MKVNEDFQETDKTISSRIMEEQTENWSEQCQICYGKGCDECNQTGEILYTNENVLNPGIEFTLNYIRSQESKQRLFNLMSEEHNLTLLDGELYDIIFALTEGLSGAVLSFPTNDEELKIFDEVALEEEQENDNLKGKIIMTDEELNLMKEKSELLSVLEYFDRLKLDCWRE